MTRRLSQQSIAVLRALARQPQVSRHGYDLGRELGLKAGTLYPILMRLADRGLVEATWEADPPTGRPRRHLYRILGAGELVVAAEREGLDTLHLSQSAPLTSGKPKQAW